MFAAQAGAKHVYGIDMSDIITDAREIIRLNGFEDRITLLQGKVEDITLPVLFFFEIGMGFNVNKVEESTLPVQTKESVLLTDTNEWYATSGGE